jgi:hypothetical protein
VPGALSGRDLDDARRDIEATWPGTAILSMPGTVLDAEGGWSDGYTAMGTVPALLHPLSSSDDESLMGGQLHAEGTFVLWIPHDGTIGPDWQVSYAGTAYDVVNIAEWNVARIDRRVIVAHVGDD